MQSLLGTSGPAAVHLIFEDRAGNLWVATEAHGLFLIGAHGTRHFGMADGLPSDWVISIHEDERGIFWLGTTDGLALWRDGKLISLARFRGPLRETIMQLLEDDAHQMWLTTNKGLMSVPRAGARCLGRRRHQHARVSHLRRCGRLAHGRVRRRQHLRRLSFAGRASLVPERARHRESRSQPHSDQYPAAARAHRAGRRRWSAAERSATASRSPRARNSGSSTTPG